MPLEAANDLQEIIHKEARNDYEPTTGVWFTDSHPLRQWISGAEPLRWLVVAVSSTNAYAGKLYSAH